MQPPSQGMSGSASPFMMATAIGRSGGRHPPPGLWASSPRRRRSRRFGARFWSLAIVDQANREIANLSDFEITLGQQKTYRVMVRAACGDQRNCLDASRAPAPGSPGRIFYRLFVPDGSDTGSVPLPTVSYVVASGAPGVVSPLPSGTWTQLVATFEVPLRPGGAIHDATASATGVERPVAQGQTAPDPQAERFQGPGYGQVQTLSDAGAPKPVVGALEDTLGPRGLRSDAGQPLRDGVVHDARREPGASCAGTRASPAACIGRQQPG